MATGNCSSGKGYISAASNVRLHPSELSRMTNLEDDLLVEILIRLPNPRYSCRCKSVCKRWTTLISSPHFNRRFVSHHQSRYQPMLLSYYDPLPIIQDVLPAALPTDEDPKRRFVVWDSFKDLVLCGFTDSTSGNFELDRSYIVCNPFTKQWIALPIAPAKPFDYAKPCSRLVGEPSISSASATVNLDLGDGQAFAYSSEYRFRVVCMYTTDINGDPDPMKMRLDLFCSDSGEWTKDALVLDFADGEFDWELISHEGELLCVHPVFDAARGTSRGLLAELHPFRLNDLPPSYYVDASEILDGSPNWNLTISQGALHYLGLDRNVLTVWRLEEDCKSWRKLCKSLVNMPSSMGNYKLGLLYPVHLHPEKSEIVFLAYYDPDTKRCNIYTHDLTRSGGQLEYFAENGPDWSVVQAKVSGWPTPIPRYKELRGMYNGSHSCWVQSSEAATPSSVW